MSRDESLYEARLAVLLSVIETRYKGVRADFAQATKLPASYITRMLKRPGEKDCKRIGDDMARKLEGVADLGLAPGQLLHPTELVTRRPVIEDFAERLSADDREVIALFRRIGSTSSRSKAIGYLQALADATSASDVAPELRSRKRRAAGGR
jgi:hypothetical protein